ncbi:MAG: hypothetical protein QM527_04070 [Alphaproteobacteria bacterium]|nr:hypothetical protein [Alphaproteobacteria bacterium]
MADHLRHMPHGWLRNSLQHRFVLVDIRRQSPRRLAKLDNLVALIMRLELPHHRIDVGRS